MSKTFTHFAAQAAQAQAQAQADTFAPFAVGDFVEWDQDANETIRGRIIGLFVYPGSGALFSTAGGHACAVVELGIVPGLKDGRADQTFTGGGYMKREGARVYVSALAVSLDALRPQGRRE